MKRALLVSWLLLPAAAMADPAAIEDVAVHSDGEGWTVSVTLSHADTGWEDFADAWRVELPDGTVLATRELSHPHVTEQPFTRSITGVAVPEEAHTLVIRARTKPDGWDGATQLVDLP